MAGEQSTPGGSTPAAASTGDPWLSLLGQEIDAQFGTTAASDDEKTRVAIADAVAVLAAKASQGTIPNDIVRYINGVIAEIDQQLEKQVNEVIHHPEFQELEATWRGLDFLVRRTPARDNLKLRVLPISKTELAKELDKYSGARWQQSAVFKRIYGDGIDKFNGEPYGCVIGAYYFDHTAPDIKLLQELSKTAASAHCPFIASAGPKLMRLENWSELNNPESLKAIMATPERAAWRALRDMDDSRYLGLTMPRFLARDPYGENNPVEEFSFVEQTGGSDASKFCWANAAFAMGANINRAFSNYGWCVKIRDVEGGKVENLPTHTFPTDSGGVDSTCPTEIAIGKIRATEIEELGLIPLCHFQNTNYAVFNSANSVQLAKNYDDPDAKSNAELSARLQYMFAVSRFSHYLDAMAVHWRGKFTSREELQRDLATWMKQYVLANPQQHSEGDKARKPLAHADVQVEDVEGKPGFYRATFRLKPHFQFEGIKASVRLVSKEFAGKA
jgi:type VI secretion system protein ImpC